MAKLDVVLAQVLIEAVIIAVTLTDSRTWASATCRHAAEVGNWTGVGAINNRNFLRNATTSTVSGATNTSGFCRRGSVT